ncbi:MAG: Gfo/Idh/MocA family oxidoreductase [Ectothiorhodospiraceae bacterium]|nr:Gfo/Idh/MocA family oxidoreductase [Chromatiales bacterium]MCP5154089.1 Gfo/Idh/MocA family oxidoreductase [Ectothiorhodospiraceae bacterium]
MSATSASAKAIRVGMLSFAHYHANFWSEVLAGERVLAGIWDSDVERGREAAERFGVPFRDDLDALLDECTAVGICSETSRHPELVRAAAERGLAVLCEKPIATDDASAATIVEAVRTHGITFMQSFPKRYDPVSHRIKAAVDQGELGELTLVRVRHGHHYGLTDDFRTRWYVQPELAGGGALLDEGVHGADLLAWLFGLPVAVSAVVSRAALGLPVEDLGVATFEFESGLVAELTASFTFAGADASIELYGTRGSLLVAGVDLASRDLTDERFVRVFREAERSLGWQTEPLVPRFKQGQYHQQNAIQFLACLRTGAPPPVTVDDGARALRMIRAAYRAASTGTRQRV